MDANQLLYYMRGFFELVSEPTAAHMQAIRTEILRAQPVKAEFIPIDVVNGKAGDCDCKKH